MSTNDYYYITSPIYYVNDSPHIGHAYTSLACDILARFKRLENKSVIFLTGTDEHGQKVEKSASNAGISPEIYVNEVSKKFKNLSTILNFSNDDFIRTTEKRHIETVEFLWNKMLEQKDIYMGKYCGWYAIRDEAFYLESELINGLAPTGASVEWIEEDSYFFKLSNYQEKLLAYYENHKDFIAPISRYNEVVSFVKNGLTDLSISRTSFSWGIKVPNDRKHVIYVWLDALTNYISALGYPHDKEKFSKYWPAMHIVGKDILRFHAIYWPAFLMACDLPLPKKIIAHGWWTNEGQKISKSLGNTIDPIALVEKYGLDQTRYFLMREVPFGNDGNFSLSSFINRINSELANKIGNLVQRTLSLIFKNCNAEIPNFDYHSINDIKTLYIETPLLNQIEQNFKKFSNYLDNQDFSCALELLVNYATEMNVLIDSEEPWNLLKSDVNRMYQVLYILAEGIRNLALQLLPFIPCSAEKILNQLGVPKQLHNFSAIGMHNSLIAKQKISQPKAIFPRYVEQVNLSKIC